MKKIPEFWKKKIKIPKLWNCNCGLELQLLGVVAWFRSSHVFTALLWFGLDIEINHINIEVQVER